MNVTLRDATLQLGEVVQPRMVGGRGYACCGATRLFRLTQVPEAPSLQALMRTTFGRAHAVFLKWGFCPSMADVNGQTGRCTGFCTLQWLSRRGEYSGTLYNVSEALVRVPYGMGDQPDKRRAGAWYIGVQALPNELVEFTLEASLFDTSVAIGAGASCDRLTGACGVDSARDHIKQDDRNGVLNLSMPLPPPPPFPPPMSRLERASDLLGDQVAGATLSTVGAFLGFLFCILCCRTANRVYRQRVVYSDWWFRFTEETRVGQLVGDALPAL
eukprot:6695882-Prymnesium_polylepis.1